VDTTTLIWIIVGILAVAPGVNAVFAFTARGRSQRHQQAQHAKAEQLRGQAREPALAAREKEAEPAQARADAAAAVATAEQSRARAAQAEVDAQRVGGQADEHRAEAERLRGEQAEALRKADDVDPYAGRDAGRQPADDGQEDRPAETPEERPAEAADERPAEAAGERPADETAPQRPITRPRADEHDLRRPRCAPAGGEEAPASDGDAPAADRRTARADTV